VHPLVQITSTILLMIVVEEFVSLMIGLWGKEEDDVES
jgi:hypothetical protein